MLELTSTSTSQPWGVISLGSGALALFMGTVGCLAGVSYFSLPVSVLGLVAGEMEVRKARRGEPAEMSHATLGIVLSTVTLAVHLMTTMAFIFILAFYILLFVGAVIFG
ncbi:MAG: hypothetical protein ACJA00_000394 [Myxococcota bacterium]